jgi:hypothetical protein
VKYLQETIHTSTFDTLHFFVFEVDTPVLRN